MTAKFKSDTYSSCLQLVLDEYRLKDSSFKVEIKALLVLEDFASSVDVHRERSFEELGRLRDGATERMVGVQNDGHTFTMAPEGLSYVLDSVRRHDAEMTNALTTLNALLRVLLGTGAVSAYAEKVEEALSTEAAQRRQDSKDAPKLYAVKASS